jgi:hypothetical protein
MLERLSQIYSPVKSRDALERWQNQIPGLAGALHAWWQWQWGFKRSLPKRKTLTPSIGC